MSQLMTYEKDDRVRIKSIKLTNVKLSYPFLITPRPTGQFGEGDYGSEFMIYDQETVELVTEYVQYCIDEALPGWGGKIPNPLKMPFRAPDGDNNKYEEGALLIIKAKTFKTADDQSEQPKLYIRDDGQKYPRELTQEDVECYAIAAGNIVDAFVTLHQYTYKGKSGISAKVTAVCKIGEGTPIEGRAKLNLIEEFTDPNGEEEITGFEKEEAVAPVKINLTPKSGESMIEESKPLAKKKLPAKVAVKPPVVKPVKASDLIASAISVEQEKVEPTASYDGKTPLTLADLIKE